MKTSAITSAIMAILLAIQVSAQPVAIRTASAVDITVRLTHDTAITLGLNDRQERKLYRLNMEWTARYADRCGRIDWDIVLAHRYAEYTRDLSRILNGRQLRQWRVMHERRHFAPAYSRVSAPPRHAVIHRPAPHRDRRPADRFDKAHRHDGPQARPDGSPDRRPQMRRDNRRPDHGPEHNDGKRDGRRPYDR